MYMWDLIDTNMINDVSISSYSITFMMLVIKKTPKTSYIVWVTVSHFVLVNKEELIRFPKVAIKTLFYNLALMYSLFRYAPEVHRVLTDDSQRQSLETMFVTKKPKDHLQNNVGLTGEKSHISGYICRIYNLCFDITSNWMWASTDQQPYLWSLGILVER